MVFLMVLPLPISHDGAETFLAGQLLNVSGLVRDLDRLKVLF
jgi:hypothetical protein